MSYSTNNPPRMLTPSMLGKGGAIWLYEPTGKPDDDGNDPTAAGYITNGAKLGMQVGDIVFIRYGNSMGLPYSVLSVTAPTFGTNGPVTLSNKVTETP